MTDADPAGVHPIEVQSYAIMARHVDLSAWSPGARDVVARMIHATADESFAETARIGGDAVAAAIEALRNRAPVICDARMVVAGVPQVARHTDVRCYLDAAPNPTGDATTLTRDATTSTRDATTSTRDATTSTRDATTATATTARTRSAAAIATAARDHPAGALWVIGNAPTALVELLALHHAGRLEPAAVIGVPVGYVGAAEAKAALWDSRLQTRSITNAGRRGGSPVAAAALNALYRLAAGSRPTVAD